MSENPAAGQEALERLQRWTLHLGQAQQALLDYATQHQATWAALGSNPLGLWDGLTALTQAAADQPERWAQHQAALISESMALWQRYLTPAAEPLSAQPLFDLLRQSYQLISQHLLEAIAGLTRLDEEEKTRARFFTQQFLDALSPANFAWSNPEVIQETIATNGYNLIKGMQNLVEDLKLGRMRQVDESAFAVGENLATTKGEIVYRNRLFELIHYSPTTPTQYAVPLLIFPAWINKYYILDLTAEKSFVRWALDQGFAIFMVSWKNPDASLADVTLESYMREGQIEALNVVRAITAAPKVHAIGYCVAGTTLAATLAWLTARGEADQVATATFFAAQVDFSAGGDLKIFTGDAQLATIAALGADKGYFDGRYIATSFNMLRANDLIWHFVVNNYLLGKDYFPFDLLYWNSDATHVPARWHLDYMRDFYRDNLLIQPGGITVAGIPIDLHQIRTPAYVQASRDDHIAPAASVFKMSKTYRGPVRFLLAGSGHIAGVVNPPAAQKYAHWTSDQPADSYADFLAQAQETKGSWWPDWLAWISPQSGEQQKAWIPGAHPDYPALVPAPGVYVRERI